jgi:hypothetical protein
MMHLVDHYEEEKGDNLFLLVDPEVVRGEFDRLQDGVRRSPFYPSRTTFFLNAMSKWMLCFHPYDATSKFLSLFFNFNSIQFKPITTTTTLDSRSSSQLSSTLI